MDKQKLKEVVRGYLEENRLMTVGTSYKDRPWLATVFFAVTPDMQSIFFSKETTLHGQNIAKNPYVSATINQVWGKPGLVKGVQLQGKAMKVPQSKFDGYFQLFTNRYAWAKDYAKDHVLYIIEPDELWYIDHELHGHFNRIRVI